MNLPPEQVFDDEAGLAIELDGVDCAFGTVVAVRGGKLCVRAGTVHALVGENGAGKLTLMKIAYGQVRPQRGTLRIKGNEVRNPHSPARAIAAGVGMVHQHFMLVPSLTVLENIVLGQESGFVLELERARREVVELSERLRIEVRPDAILGELTVGEQQRVEILKVLWRGCDVLILDEPTAVLTPGEVGELFEVLRDLVADGATVVLITHKLDEVVGFADDITVMRAGSRVAMLNGATTTAQEVANCMVGRSVLLSVDRSPATPGDVRLKLDEVVVESRSSPRPAVDGVSLSVRAAEIVGIAGVLGNGQSELCAAIAGLDPVRTGSIHLLGRDVTRARVDDRFAAGLAVVAEDRQHRGLVLDMTVEENLVLGDHRGYCSVLRMDRAAIRRHAAEAIKRADIRPSEPTLEARALSGGNQQKIVLARELGREPRVLLCSQPTRGVDIGASEQIHRDIVAARDAGLAVLLVSSDLSELCALSDRVAVMYRGRITRVLEAAELAADGARARIGELMTGAEVA